MANIETFPFRVMISYVAKQQAGGEKFVKRYEHVGVTSVEEARTIAARLQELADKNEGLFYSQRIECVWIEHLVRSVVGVDFISE